MSPADSEEVFTIDLAVTEDLIEEEIYEADPILTDEYEESMRKCHASFTTIKCTKYFLDHIRTSFEGYIQLFKFCEIEGDMSHQTLFAATLMHLWLILSHFKTRGRVFSNRRRMMEKDFRQTEEVVAELRPRQHRRHFLIR